MWCVTAEVRDGVEWEPKPHGSQLFKMSANLRIKKFSSFGQNMHAIDGWNRLDKTIAMVLAARSESALSAPYVQVKMKI
jgi:hypothetical protein